jgi:hypothetical protein
LRKDILKDISFHFQRIAFHREDTSTLISFWSQSVLNKPKCQIFLYTATLIIAKGVIPAKAGIQKKTGFRVKPGMTDRKRLMSSYIIYCSSVSSKVSS